VKLDVEVSPGLPFLHASARELEECIINLLLNARDASPARGTVTLRAQARSGCVEITVDDEGTGIPERDRARVFEPFFTTKPEMNGTGLGLAIVKHVVQRHRGSFLVESEPGRGSAFGVVLPMRRAGSA
jgi:signal transduction histidine kinase